MNEQLTFEIESKPPIRGFPELRWAGKRPYKSTTYYPAQLRERYGKKSGDNWINRLFWGDNLHVMSHLLKDFRGKVELIYIDPPSDNKADYKKKIILRSGQTVISDSTSFEEKQYSGIWINDEYLQFMYERLLLMRELLSDTGSIYVHLDERWVHHVRLILDEVFGTDSFRREIIWNVTVLTGFKIQSQNWIRSHDILLYYSKATKPTFNKLRQPLRQKYIDMSNQTDEPRALLEETKEIQNYSNVWDNIKSFQQQPTAAENLGYPTQKPKALLERIINASTNPSDLVLDCFMGSGTTQAVAMRLGRRFIGVDINLGAIQTATKRLLGITEELSQAEIGENTLYTGFEVYNMNNYDFFRNPLEAKLLLIEALGIQAFPEGHIYDGELDGRMVKIMPVNRIATKADLEELRANLPYKTFEKRKTRNPTAPVEKITIVCMGHEPDLQNSLKLEIVRYKIDIQICDVLRDKSGLQLKREAEADIAIEGRRLVIRQFYPINLIHKLSLQKDYVKDWRQLVESVMIDWNFDGVAMEPSVIDVPGKNELVKGIYDIPANAGTVKVKITDVISESLETEVRV